jgi:hypothetical protein
MKKNSFALQIISRKDAEHRKKRKVWFGALCECFAALRGKCQVAYTLTAKV